MRAARLRHRVTLEQRVDVNDAGSVTTTWPVLGEVWGSVEPIRGREALRAGGILAEMSTRIMLRYNSLSAQLTARDRIRFAGKIYNLASDPVQANTGGVDMECMCSSGINDG